MGDDKLIERLRSERHDFLNHLQTVYGMAQLKRNKQILNYIQSLNEELTNIKISKTNNHQSILDPILMTKKKAAEKEGIKLLYHLDKGLKTLDVELNRIFRIVFNLIDNAVEALKDRNGYKKIRIMGENTIDNYILSVYNNKSVINQELINELFKPGFSTKGKERGYGLYIIKSLVEETGGKLKVKSEEGFGTQFICYFPK